MKKEKKTCIHISFFASNGEEDFLELLKAVIIQKIKNTVFDRA